MVFTHEGIKVTADSKEEAVNIFKKTVAITNKIEKAMKELSVTESARTDADYKGQGKVAKFIREFATKPNDANAKVVVRFEGSVELDEAKTTVKAKVTINNCVVANKNLGGKLNKKFDDNLEKILDFVIGFTQLG